MIAIFAAFSNILISQPGFEHLRLASVPCSKVLGSPPLLQHFNAPNKGNKHQISVRYIFIRQPSRKAQDPSAGKIRKGKKYKKERKKMESNSRRNSGRHKHKQRAKRKHTKPKPHVWPTRRMRNVCKYISSILLV